MEYENHSNIIIKFEIKRNGNKKKTMKMLMYEIDENNQKIKRKKNKPKWLMNSRMARE